MADTVNYNLPLPDKDGGSQRQEIDRIAQAIAAVDAALRTLSGYPPAARDSLEKISGELDALLSLADASGAAITALQQTIAQLAPLLSPGLGGTPTAPTAAPGTNDNLIATTAFVQAEFAARPASVTLATLPDPATMAGKQVFCTNLGGGAGPLVSDGTKWRHAAPSGQQTITTDAASTIQVLVNAENQKHTGTLTASRTITLSTTGAYPGARFRVSRSGGGAFALNIGGLKNLTTNTWVEVVFDGAAWYSAGVGNL